MPGTPGIDADGLADYLSRLEREEYGDRLIDDFASTGAPDICIEGVNVPEEFQFAISHLNGGTGRPAIVYGDTLDGILAQYTDQPLSGSVLGWIRNGNQLQVHYPSLSETQVDVVGIATGHLPSYNGERMQIAIPAGATDEQIAEELMISLGGLLTHEDVAALLANLPQQRDEPLLVDIYELYQEILARYQTRLHSDERVWVAEIETQRAQITLAAHIEEHGEFLDCESEVPQTDLTICQERRAFEDWTEDTLSTYIDNLATVNNEMIDSGLMPLMDEQISNQSEAREMFVAATVAAIAVFVPLTLEDVAIDAATAGLGRIRRVGDAIADMVRGAGRAALNRVRNITDAVQERVQNVRRGGTRTNSETQGAVTNLGTHTAANNSDIISRLAPGEGMSGVFDHQTGRFILRHSTNQIPLPAGSVARYGGHRVVRNDLSTALGEDLTLAASGRISGFSISRQADGSIGFGWNSGQINPGSHGDRGVPEALRSEIESAVRAALGI
jgi:hypothetical protein